MANLLTWAILLVVMIPTNAYQGDTDTSHPNSNMGQDNSQVSGDSVNPDPIVVNPVPIVGSPGQTFHSNTNAGSFNFDIDDHLSSLPGGQTGDNPGVSFVGTVPDDDTSYDGVSSNTDGHTFDSSSSVGGGNYNFDFGNIPGVSFVGGISDDNVNDVPMMDSNVAADSYGMNTGGGSFDFNDHVGSLPGVNFVDGEGRDDSLPGVKFVGTVVDDVPTSEDTGTYEHTWPKVKNGQAILDGASWISDGELPGIYGMSDNMLEHIPSNEEGQGGNGYDILYSDDGNHDNSGVSTYVPETTSETTGGGNYDTTTVSTVWKPMNCYVGDRVYEEGDGTRSSINPCMMHLCEAGRMNKYPTACFMDGICHNEGTKWKSNCVVYTCMLTNAGFRAIETNKGCEFKRKNGEKKCLKNGQIVRDGPCKKRQCKVSKFNDHYVAELPLVKNSGGCGYAKGCRSPGEVWNYRCVTKKCVCDGYNFYKLPLHANCIRRGRCYSGGESYTTPNTCVTRTCFVNNIINIAWFEKTGRGCKFGGICIKEGEKRIKRCKEFTCTEITTYTGKTRMVMKKTNKNDKNDMFWCSSCTCCMDLQTKGWIFIKISSVNSRIQPPIQESCM